MKTYLDVFTVISVLAVLLMPATLQAAPYETNMEEPRNNLVLHVSETVKKLREELNKLPPEERATKMKEIREERAKHAKKITKPAKEISPAEKAKRKKAQQARRAKAEKERVILSPEQQAKQAKESFKKRLKKVSPERKSEICERRLALCSDDGEDGVDGKNKRSNPMCKIVKEECS